LWIIAEAGHNGIPDRAQTLYQEPLGERNPDRFKNKVTTTKIGGDQVFSMIDTLGVLPQTLAQGALILARRG